MTTIFNLLVIVLIILAVIDLKVNHSVKGNCKENTLNAIEKSNSPYYQVQKAMIELAKYQD